MDFNHVGIKCSDVEAALKFYTEVLEMKLDFEVEILGKRCVFLNRGTLDLELEEVKTKTPPPAGFPEFGLSHLAFKVNDIEATANDLKSRGAQFLIPPFQVRPTRKTAFIKAPDGVLIQLVEDLPE